MWPLRVNVCTIAAVWTPPEHIWPTRLLSWNVVLPRTAHTLHVSYLNLILRSQWQANPLPPVEWHAKMLFGLFWVFLVCFTIFLIVPFFHCLPCIVSEFVLLFFHLRRGKEGNLLKVKDDMTVELPVFQGASWVDVVFWATLNFLFFLIG